MGQRIPSPNGGPRRSNTSIMDETMRAAYGSDTNSMQNVPQGYFEEKWLDPNHPLPMPNATPIQNATIRRSIASWFRRTGSGAHPLKLNPNNTHRWSRSTTRTASDAESQYPASIYSAYANSPAGDAPPPMPALPVWPQSMEPVELPVELPAFVPVTYDRNLAETPQPYDSQPQPYNSQPQPYNSQPQPYNSHWSQSTAPHDRNMSMASAWADATAMRFAGGRGPIPAMPDVPDLSPEFPRRTPSAETELTHLRHELLALYKQSTDNAADRSSQGGKERA